MEIFVFNQLEFARNQTLKALEDVSEDMAIRIPEGFRNSILWQAGHIYLVQERFAFLLNGLEARIPHSFMALFGPGSTPMSWNEQPPSLSDVRVMLREQQQRLAPELRERVGDKVVQPYTTSSGITLETIGELLNMTLYHEGMHFHGIKMYKTLLK